MRMTVLAATAMSVMTVLPAFAQNYTQFPAPYPYPFQRSYASGRFVVVPPYRRPFVVRTYTTPPQQPYYNVPPYSVIAPY